MSLGDIEQRLWGWLKDPSPETVASLLRALKGPKSEELLACRHSLLWLGLLGSCEATSYLRAVWSFENATYGKPSWSLEHLDSLDESSRILLVLYNFRDGKTSLTDGPGIDFLLAPMTEKLGGTPSEVKCLQEAIRAYERPNPAGHCELIIDLKTQTITSLKSEEVQFTPALSAALALLVSRQFIKFEELLFECCGLPRYDPYYHDSRLHNLLNRVRKLAPFLKVRTKEGMIFVSGDRSMVHLIPRDRYHTSLKHNAEWEKLKSLMREASTSGISKKKFAEKSLSAKFGNSRMFSRKDIESLFELSRSSSVRLISKLLGKGFLVRDGRAKNTYYKISDSGSSEDSEL